jgi:hypothetical protein
MSQNMGKVQYGCTTVDCTALLRGSDPLNCFFIVIESLSTELLLGGGRPSMHGRACWTSAGSRRPRRRSLWPGQALRNLMRLPHDAPVSSQ